MRRVAVYSDSRARPGQRAGAKRAQFQFPPPPPAEKPAARADKPLSQRTIAAGVAAAVLALVAAIWFAPRGMSEAHINATIQQAVEASVQPRLLAADAYDKIVPSVVHVRGLMTDADAPPEVGKEPKDPAKQEEAKEGDPVGEGNVGTGVVIVDDGTILTNLHVVHGSKRIKVTFHDGLEAEADVIGVRPEHDLAVLKARKVPDDLFPATLRSTNGLRPGDEVVAVGFPFGIGPSASAGVISGLKREYRSQGKRVLTNLIQFDAAVNPGNSGGPLVTLDGEVIGIVTGLLNPTEQRVFVGIGFAVPIENAAAAAGLNPF